jgi:hypothetical protein
MARTQYVDPIWWAESSGAAINTTTTETAIFTAKVIPADYFTLGRMLRVRACGQYSTTGTPTMLFGLRYGTATGGVLLWKTAAITGASGITAALWDLDLILRVTAAGSAGTIFAIGTAILHSGAAPTVGSATGAPGISGGAVAGQLAPASSAACDLTTATGLTLTATWGTNSASNTLTGHLCVYEGVN